MSNSTKNAERRMKSAWQQRRQDARDFAHDLLFGRWARKGSKDDQIDPRHRAVRYIVLDAMIALVKMVSGSKPNYASLWRKALRMLAVVDRKAAQRHVESEVIRRIDAGDAKLSVLRDLSQTLTQGRHVVPTLRLKSNGDLESRTEAGRRLIRAAIMHPNSTVRSGGWRNTRDQVVKAGILPKKEAYEVRCKAFEDRDARDARRAERKAKKDADAKAKSKTKAKSSSKPEPKPPKKSSRSSRKKTAKKRSERNVDGGLAGLQDAFDEVKAEKGSQPAKAAAS